MNLLKFLHNCIDNKNIHLNSHYIGKNRANNTGDALECYIKDGFSNNFLQKNETERNLNYNRYFSYLGNKNNPPDLILKNSDAIEIKKIESKNSALALNSSYPKNKLYSDSSMITQACKNCENWSIKNILYTIGHVTNNDLHTLWLIYGECFAADKTVYERIKNKIEQGINEIPDVEFTETNEIGKVKKVDPLGVTDLRIRGMWHIENPNKIFAYLNAYTESAQFQIICLMTKSKYNSFSAKDRKNLANIKESEFKISEVQIKNPDNPAKFIKAILITYRRFK